MRVHACTRAFLFYCAALGQDYPRIAIIAEKYLITLSSQKDQAESGEKTLWRLAVVNEYMSKDNYKWRAAFIHFTNFYNYEV